MKNKNEWMELEEKLAERDKAESILMSIAVISFLVIGSIATAVIIFGQ